MRQLFESFKPSRGFGHIVYLALNVLLPVLVLLLVKAELTTVAFAVILLSKWRMFAVQPRFWLANIRANAVDILVGLSILAFMIGTATDLTRIVYALAWAVWLVGVKPKTSPLWVSMQAFIGQALGLMAIFSVWSRASLVVLVLAVGITCFFAAHHFFYSFDEPYIRLLAYVYAYFAAGITWVLGHWLMYHSFMAQPTLLLLSISFGLGTLYYLDHFDRLSSLIRKEVIFMMSTIVFILAGTLLVIDLA